MDDVKDAFAKLREKPKPPASGTPQDMEEYLRRKRAWERQFRRSTAWETLRQLAERQKSQPPPVIPETVRKHLDSEEVREAVGKSVSEAFNRHRAVCPMCGAFNPRISFINLDGESLRHFFPSHPSTKRSLREMRERLASQPKEADDERVLSFQMVCENGHQWAMAFHMRDGAIEWETHNVYVPMDEE